MSIEEDYIYKWSVSKHINKYTIKVSCICYGISILGEFI